MARKSRKITCYEDYKLPDFGPKAKRLSIKDKINLHSRKYDGFYWQVVRQGRKGGYDDIWCNPELFKESSGFMPLALFETYDEAQKFQEFISIKWNTSMINIKKVPYKNVLQKNS